MGLEFFELLNLLNVVIVDMLVDDVDFVHGDTRKARDCFSNPLLLWKVENQ